MWMCNKEKYIGKQQYREIKLNLIDMVTRHRHVS